MINLSPFLLLFQLTGLHKNKRLFSKKNFFCQMQQYVTKIKKKENVNKVAKAALSMVSKREEGQIVRKYAW